MIIDFKTDPLHAQMYEILDLYTGRWISHLPIFYADDEKGIIKLYQSDKNGNLLLDPQNPNEVAQEEYRISIKICLKSHIEDAEQELAHRKEEMAKFRRGEDANIDW